jgi:predicted MFS family arabinose efflux permease
VIGLGGFEWAFAVNTVSFLAVIAAIAPLELPPPPRTHGESIVRSIRNGARFARTEPGIRAVIGYLWMNSLLAAPFIALVPAVALEVFHSGESGTATLVTAQGLGAVTMALLLGNLIMRLGHRRLLRLVLAGLPVALAGYAVAPQLWVAAIAIFFVGLFYLGCLSSFTTIAQLRAPAELRGRVLSALMVLLGTLYPIGSIVQGAIADETSLRVTTGATAALLALWIVGIRVFRPGYDRHLDDVADETDTTESEEAEAEERLGDAPLPGGSVPAT